MKSCDGHVFCFLAQIIVNKSMAHQILLVDDDKDLVYILREALQKNGFEVITASDGSEGLRLLKTNIPQLIMADLTMPVMSGWHFTTKVRQDPRFKKTPIIVLSGLLEDNAEAQPFESASLYVRKPFEIFELIAKIKELIAAQS